jgi:APA family basic amino acid/polyamine antiporter
MNDADEQAEPGALRRALGLWSATALVAGTIIGTGVFKKPAVMAAQVGSTEAVLAAWIVAGLLSVAGALTYAELGARLPRAGGEYVYLREAYGRFPAFMFGWMRFWIGSPGSIAAFAVAAAEFLGAVVPLEAFPFGPTGLAVTLIATLTTVNVAAVSFGAGVQTALTAIKVLAIVALGATLFALGRSSDAAPAQVPVAPGGFSAFVSAVLAALWAFDGWNNLAMVGGEVKNPRRTIPLALMAGMAIVGALYLFADRAYFHVLSVGEAAASAQPGAPPVATAALGAAAGPVAVTLVSLAFVVSALGAMAGSILTGARVPYAMAKDGLFASALARISPRTQVPAVAVVVLGVVSSLLAISGSFDQLTDSVVFAAWIFYGMGAGALLRLRRRTPPEPGAFSVPLYPVLPIVFIALAGVLLVNTVVTAPHLTALGLGVLGLGLPVYVWVRRRAGEPSK